MKVSIITPVYNAERYICKTYESIRDQTHIDWEWLVTDDKSSDNTLAILKELSKIDCRIRIYTNLENSGAAISRNNSIKHATGDFIAFIDSDDLWLPDKLEQQLKFMSNGISFSFTAYELIDLNGNSLNRTVDSSHQGSFSYNDMLKKKATLGCSTVMLRRESFPEISMPLIRTGQDYALWLKLLKSGHNAHLLNTVLTKYRVLPNSISRNKVKKAIRQWEIYRKLENLDLINSSINFCFYAFRAIFRKL
ncbi:glycosyltransferase family 2 protein [Grimontia hollisae]|uniref:glycosyltransferase family 2 protein n=1 Tax=Grimontia hollisae TaxID=673 RepID=UPI00165D5EF7|nr:glycosyltransferase family 2 protein [Grimontia hollisae]